MDPDTTPPQPPAGAGGAGGTEGSGDPNSTGVAKAAAAQRQSETHEDLAAVTRVLLGLEAPVSDDDTDQEVDDRRREVSGRRQRILDELSFLDD